MASTSTKYAPAYRIQPLWEGPSKLVTIRTSKAIALQSLLQASYRESTGMSKQHRAGLVHLDRLGFEADEQVFAAHGGPEKAVLQYNPHHYQEWKEHFKQIKVDVDGQRAEALSYGGFGENIAVENVKGQVPMDENTMCVGDLIGFYRLGDDDSDNGDDDNAFDIRRLKAQAKMRVTGSRMPCFKLNHRYGLPNMSQRAQDKFWTGWLYSVETAGDVQAGDRLVLLERPFPDWPVAKTQHYMYRDTMNLDMMRQAIDVLGQKLVYDVRGLFQNRLTKGLEDMSQRLQGAEQKDVFVKYRLRNRLCETEKVSEFTFERIEQLPKDSKDYMKAKSGSHIRLRFKADSSQITRPYSVLSGDSNGFKLGIALADESRGGSYFLHRKLKQDHVLECSERFANTFPLEEQATNHVFLAGGIGITAFVDHIKHCLITNQMFHLHYMIRRRSDYAFKTLINSMLKSTKATASPDSSIDSQFGDMVKISTYVSAEGRRCDIPNLLKNYAGDEGTHIYVCGGEKMSDSIRETATELKIADSRMHFEQFTMDGSGDPFVADLTLSKNKIEVGSRQTLLEALRETGLEVPSSCEAGNCGTCKVRVRCGRVLHKGNGLTQQEKAGFEGREDGEILTCVSRGVGTIALEI